MILRLAVLVELRLVTDRHRHRAIAYTADAWRRAVKMHVNPEVQLSVRPNYTLNYKRRAIYR